MNTDLSNQVIAHFNRAEAVSPQRRTLDLANIQTAELGLLSPQRNEIAPKGLGRDSALLVYSERLRESYRRDEGGIRDGMFKLGEAYRNGQVVTVSCQCRAGELCHADVVKVAIEKVGQSLIEKAANRQGTQEVADRTATNPPPNPRTQRAINEILSEGRSDLFLSKLGDTGGMNRSEYASHLNRQSQLLRDLYERGAVVRDGVLIAPKDNPSSSAPVALTSLEYAVKRLGRLVDESRAKELAPRIVEHANKIAGESADRDTQIKVFNWVYGALEGRNDLLKEDDKVPGAETKEERFDRTLNEIANLAEEMSKLEPSDRSLSVEELIELEGGEKDRSDDDLFLEKIYEGAIALEHHADREPERTDYGIQEFERVELEDVSLSRLARDMPSEDLDKWIEVRLPVLDEMLEEGMPVDTILKPFQVGIYEAAKNEPREKQSAVDDLRFASAYIKHQLKQPESRLRHFNPRYREYALMLERALSREEVIDAASRIRLENAQLGFRWESLTDIERTKTAAPLSSKEMQFLFTEASPRHYTSEMTATRLAYVNAGEAARAKTEALKRGEITASKEASQLIESLESRMERKHLKDSVSATKHFLQSLKTPNGDLRYKNRFDHAEVYGKLPPAERDFVYQRAVEQKDLLESKLIDGDKNRPPRSLDPGRVGGLAAAIDSFRKSLKGDLVELFAKNSAAISSGELGDRTSLLVERNLEALGSRAAEKADLTSIGRDLKEGILTHLGREQLHSGPKDSVRETRNQGTVQRYAAPNFHER